MSTYNLNMIEKMAADDQEFIRAMARTFTEEIPMDILAMNEAIENENAPLAFQIVHKMKPNLQLFGLDLIVEIERLEAWSRQDLTKEEILPSASRIAQIVGKATEELKSDFQL